MHQDNLEVLQTWQSPSQLYAQADAAIDSINLAQLDSNPAKPFKESWVIGRAGSILGAKRARWTDEDQPDGYLDFGSSGPIPIEVTEQLHEGRRRGDEDATATMIQYQVELDAAIECNRTWLEGRVTAKLAKDHLYPRGTVLLIYHNSSLYNFDPERTRSELEDVSMLSRGNIVGSLILKGEEVYGRRTIERIRE